MSDDLNPFATAGRYVLDGHDLDKTAARFGLDADELRAYIDKPLGVGEQTNAVSEAATANKPTVTRQSNGSNGSNADRENVDLLTGVRTGDWLDSQTFPPLRYAVPGVVPEGFSLLVGSPKAGKSWAALGMLLAVASGGRALGKLAVGVPRRVLYLALEDGDRRMQDRCRTILANPYRPDDPIPPLFAYLTRIMPGMVVPTIEQFLTAYPDTTYVVIDTLGKVLPPASPQETIYQRDYRVGSRLKMIADDRPGLAIQAIHHDRKAESDDFVDRVSGTNGFAGAADTIIVLNRKRQSVDGALLIAGRDVPEGEYAISMSDAGTWTLVGNDLAEAAAAAQARAEAATGLSDLSLQVLDFVREAGPDGVARKEIVQKFGSPVDMYIKRLTDSGRLERHARGRYRDPSTHRPPLEALEPLETQVSDGLESSDARQEALETPPLTTDFRGPTSEEGNTSP